MSATDELRSELTKRGVEWKAPSSYDGSKRYDTVAGGYWFHEFDGKITIHGLTPTQAITATLGSGTCRNVHEPPKDTTFWPAPHFKCSECGATHVSMEYVFFCPNCGRKVMDE